MINTNKDTNKDINTNTGGKLLASGGFGCVFNPALKCEGETTRKKNQISKLMTERHANVEYSEIISIKKKLEHLKDYEDYFLIYDISLCKPRQLTRKDLTDYSSKCKALPKFKITKSNINANLDKLLILNIPNGGLPVDDYLYHNGSFEKMYKVHKSLMKLFKNGIIPMNKRNVYHCDIKDSNVLVDISGKTRLIDWGLCVEYEPFKDMAFPRSWKNRPLQFNVPFSVILFTDSFVEKYTTFLENGGLPTKMELEPFIIDYISSWMKERGLGHYKVINEIMFELFSESIKSVKIENKQKIIETQITMKYIINYLIDVLINFTKFGKNVRLNLRDYLDNVFIKIVDIWGFISIYLPFIEILFNNYSRLTLQDIAIFNKLQYIFVEYLYNPRHESINVNSLYLELKDLEKLFLIKLNGKIKKSNKKTKTSKTSRSSMEEKVKAKGNRTRRNTTFSFKRQDKKKRFKKPFLLLK